MSGPRTSPSTPRRAPSAAREVIARAPLDDEAYTDEERAEDEAARAEPGGISTEELRKRLGLKK